MKKSEVIFCCDICFEETKNPEKDRWFSVNGKESSLLCHSCVDRFIHDFDDWLKVLGIRVEFKYLNTSLSIKDRLGVIDIESVEANAKYPGLRQLHWLRGHALTTPRLAMLLARELC